MRIHLFALLLFPISLLGQEDSTAIAKAISYEGRVNSDFSVEENYDRMLGSFKRSFGTKSGTKLEYFSSATDSLFATSKINFVQKSLQSKENTRGTIKFDIVMRADATGVYYHLFNFYHRGNSEARYGSTDFGPLTTETVSPKISGISYKNRQQIWHEMQDTVDVNMQARLAAFEAQMKLDL